MRRRILLIEGRPDGDRAHFNGALVQRGIVGSVGFAPVRETLIGAVESIDEADRCKWLARVAALGRQAS